MIFKVGVSIFGIRRELMMGLMVADSLWTERGLTLTVTSVRDGNHRHASLHWQGAAADLRTRDLPAEWPADAMATSLRHRLTDEFDAEEEHDHIHLEFQPKG